MSSPMWRPFRRHTPPFGRSRGQSLVELALILPIFLLLIAGAVDLGRLFYAYVAIADASKEGALFGASDPKCGVVSTSCPNPRNVVWHVQNEADHLKDSNGKELTPSIACLGPGGAARGSLSACQDGDTYQVGLTFDFRLITPILGSLFEHRLILHSQSDSTVLNQSYDPIPGLSVTKEVCKPDQHCDLNGDGWVRTPTVDPKTGQPKNLEFRVGDTVQYRVTVRNNGATLLSGIRIADDAVKIWPPSGSGCSSGSTLPIGAVYSCSYKIGPLTKAQKDLQNTVTVTVGNLAPVVDEAFIDVLASPPRLEVHKEVRVFRHGYKPSWEQDLTVHQGSKVDPTVWYRLFVTNSGGSPATGFTVQDSAGQLTFDSDCPKPPSTLDPGATYWCFYAETFHRTGTVSNTMTADSKETDRVRDSAVVSVESCRGQDLVVPNLVEDPNGDPRTVADARAVWSAAGFSSTLDPATGFGSQDVQSQGPKDPFDCASATISEKVGH